MEAVGAVASVAGILGLVGQSINGIIKLQGFANDVKTASKTVNAFLRVVDSFLRTLSQIHHLLSKLPDDQDFDLDTLQWQLESCLTDIEEWKKLTCKLDPGSSNGAEAFFKKLRVAANKDGLSEFHNQVARHQRGLNISLSVLGPALNLASHSRLQAIGAQLTTLDGTHSERHDQLTSIVETSIGSLPTHEMISKTISNNINPLQSWMETSVRSPLAEKLDRVEMSTQVSIQYSRHSSASLSSLESQLSQHLSQQFQQIEDLKKLINEKLTGPTKSASEVPDYFCGAPTGIDEAFSEGRCIYCGEIMGELDSRLRGRHLIDKHHFDGCDEGCSQRNWNVLFKHLVVFHKASQFIHSSKDVFRDYKNLESYNQTVVIGSIDGALAQREETGTDTMDRDRAFRKKELSAELQQTLDYLLSESNIQGLNISKLTPEVLGLFREIDWKIQCTREAQLTLDFDFPPGMEDQVNLAEKYWNGSGPYEHLDAYELYINHVHALCPERPDLLVQFQPSLRFLRRNLKQESPGDLLDELVELGLSDVWFHHNEIQPHTPVETDLPLGKGERIDKWMLRILGESLSNRVLISRQFNIGDGQNPKLFSWVLENIAHWSLERSESENQSNSSDRALGSRNYSTAGGLHILRAPSTPVTVSSGSTYKSSPAPSKLAISDRADPPPLRMPDRFNGYLVKLFAKYPPQYGCAFCSNNFPSMIEAEKHQIAYHLRRYSRSWAALGGYLTSFNEGYTNPPSDQCQFCGDNFQRSGASRTVATSEDWLERIAHLDQIHQFHHCDHSTPKLFRRASATFQPPTRQPELHDSKVRTRLAPVEWEIFKWGDEQPLEVKVSDDGIARSVSHRKARGGSKTSHKSGSEEPLEKVESKAEHGLGPSVWSPVQQHPLNEVKTFESQTNSKIKEQQAGNEDDHAKCQATTHQAPEKSPSEAERETVDALYESQEDLNIMKVKLKNLVIELDVPIAEIELQVLDDIQEVTRLMEINITTRNRIIEMSRKSHMGEGASWPPPTAQLKVFGPGVNF